MLAKKHHLENTCLLQGEHYFCYTKTKAKDNFSTQEQSTTTILLSSKFQDPPKGGISTSVEVLSGFSR